MPPLPSIPQLRHTSLHFQLHGPRPSTDRTLMGLISSSDQEQCLLYTPTEQYAQGASTSLCRDKQSLKIPFDSISHSHQEQESLLENDTPAFPIADLFQGFEQGYNISFIHYSLDKTDRETMNPHVMDQFLSCLSEKFNSLQESYEVYCRFSLVAMSDSKWIDLVSNRSTPLNNLDLDQTEDFITFHSLPNLDVQSIQQKVPHQSPWTVLLLMSFKLVHKTGLETTKRPWAMMTILGKEFMDKSHLMEPLQKVLLQWGQPYSKEPLPIHLSPLTRVLADSCGGTARTHLLIEIPTEIESKQQFQALILADIWRKVRQFDQPHEEDARLEKYEQIQKEQLQREEEWRQKEQELTTQLQQLKEKSEQLQIQLQQQKHQDKRAQLQRSLEVTQWRYAQTTSEMQALFLREKLRQQSVNLLVMEHVAHQSEQSHLSLQHMLEKVQTRHQDLIQQTQSQQTLKENQQQRITELGSMTALLRAKVQEQEELLQSLQQESGQRSQLNEKRLKEAESCALNLARDLAQKEEQCEKWSQEVAQLRAKVNEYEILERVRKQVQAEQRLDSNQSRAEQILSKYNNNITTEEAITATTPAPVVPSKKLKTAVKRKNTAPSTTKRVTNAVRFSDEQERPIQLDNVPPRRRTSSKQFKVPLKQQEQSEEEDDSASSIAADEKEAESEESAIISPSSSEMSEESLSEEEPKRKAPLKKVSQTKPRKKATTTASTAVAAAALQQENIEPAPVAVTVSNGAVKRKLPMAKRLATSENMEQDAPLPSQTVAPTPAAAPSHLLPVKPMKHGNFSVLGNIVSKLGSQSLPKSF